ncbi:MAG: hypothetical protein ACPLRW_07055 [Moorellales bacterium]
MNWKTVNSPEDWAEVMSQLAEVNGCGYVEECLALKALREENARLRVVAEAARKARVTLGALRYISTDITIPTYDLKAVEREIWKAMTVLNQALAALEEASK